MPKKSTTARGGAQRNRPKVQRNIELVRPTSAADEQTRETQDDVDSSPVTASKASTTSADTMVAPTAKSASTSSVRTRSTTKVREQAARPATTTGKKEEDVVADKEETVVAEEPEVGEVAAPKSASARLAARRQAAQKNSQRTSVALITAEHYSYVRRDLVFIAILAIIMFAVIIVLHFVPGVGY